MRPRVSVPSSTFLSSEKPKELKMSNDNDWLVRQARASAVWLAALPAEVLSPTGRSLRASSSLWLPRLDDAPLHSVPPKKSTARSRKEAQETRRDSQLPLIASVTGDQEPSTKR